MSNPNPACDDVLDYYSLTSEQEGRDTLEEMVAQFPQYENALRAFAAFKRHVAEPDAAPCVEHQWTGAKSGVPGEPVEWVQYCAVCGAEYQGSYDGETA